MTLQITHQRKWLLGIFMIAGASCALAQTKASQDHPQEHVVQIVALDECDPTTFNAALGPDFCKNVALAPLGFATTFQDLFAKAAAGTPDPGWDFEPDTLKIKEGTALLVTDQGGEPHTFTEVKTFGGGFVSGLNAGEETVSECSGGFKNVDVAKTRLLQGQQCQSYGSVKRRTSLSVLHPPLDAHEGRGEIARGVNLDSRAAARSGCSNFSQRCGRRSARDFLPRWKRFFRTL